MAMLDSVYSVVQIAPTGVETVVRLSQNENGRTLIFAIVGGTIPSGSTVTISGTKPDGNVFSASGSMSGNTATFTESIQLTAIAGIWPAKLKVVNSGRTIATGRIRFVIDADTVAAGAVPSDSELEGLVAEAAAYAEAAKDGAYYGSPLTASTVAGMTDKTRVYVYTGSESGYTAGNWYYWNGSAWTSGGVYNSQGLNTDTTLSVAGMAADAKATGDALAAVKVETDKTLTESDVPADAKVTGEEISQLKNDFDQLEPGLSAEAKAALLACFDNVAWKNGTGRAYIDALEAALNPEEYPKITASFNPGNYTAYEGDSADTLKPYTTVKYFIDKDDAGTVIPTNNYSLVGTLILGVNTVFVVYGDYRTTITVTAEDFYNKYHWSFADGDIFMSPGTVISKAGNGMAIGGQVTTGNPTRETFVTNRGKCTYVKNSDDSDLGVYPIPVPYNATKVTITITPSNQYISGGVRLLLDTGKYKDATEKWLTYTQGTWTMDFSDKKQDNLFLQVTTAEVVNDNPYQNLPTGLTIDFED